MWRRSVLSCLAVAAMSVVLDGTGWGAPLTPKEKLGKNLFFDMRLSRPAGQSCADCHSPGAGFNGFGDASLSAYEGAVAGRFGRRNPPSAAYASFSPKFHYDKAEEMYVGGQFWDGRAATLAEQAKMPFLDANEQNNASPREVVAKVKRSEYAGLFLKVYGREAFANTGKAFNAIADAIAAYQSSSEVNKFSSRYDWYLRDKVKYPLSEQEMRGLSLFNDKGKCAECHPSEPGPYAKQPLFTDYTYDNLGIPKNPGAAGVDLGLAEFVKDPKQNGKFKVPTLRNIAVAPSYGHNGYFKTLKEIVQFYNTRDTGKWPAPEVAENVNKEELGNLGLTPQDEDDIVAFMMALTDGYAPPNPR
ncbi:MAG: c-type cytochrome [Deltaproteobacteria bacterium]|nr:c-type cytochrome [Deltaproteobacteria bacterium]